MALCLAEQSPGCRNRARLFNAVGAGHLGGCSPSLTGRISDMICLEVAILRDLILYMIFQMCISILLAKVYLIPSSPWPSLPSLVRQNLSGLFAAHPHAVPAAPPPCTETGQPPNQLAALF